MLLRYLRERGVQVRLVFWHTLLCVSDCMDPWWVAIKFKIVREVQVRAHFKAKLAQHTFWLLLPS
jgi:hypothetical protein